MTGDLGRADQWGGSFLTSLPSGSSSRLFFKCPVADGAELSLRYLSARDDVCETETAQEERKRDGDFYLFIVSEGGFGLRRHLLTPCSSQCDDDNMKAEMCGVKESFCSVFVLKHACSKLCLSSLILV